MWYILAQLKPHTSGWHFHVHTVCSIDIILAQMEPHRHERHGSGSDPGLVQGEKWATRTEAAWKLSKQTPDKYMLTAPLMCSWNY